MTSESQTAGPSPAGARVRPLRLGGASASSRPAFETLLDAHGQGVLRFCIARLGPDRGEDCFQETLIAALRGYPELREPASAKAWLFAIAHRKIIDEVRSRDRTPVPTEELANEMAATTVEATSEVWSQVAKLPAKQREAVGLRFLGELSHGEIARVMGTSEDAARRNVFEGVKRLRANLTNTAGGASFLT